MKGHVLSADFILAESRRPEAQTRNYPLSFVKLLDRHHQLRQLHYNRLPSTLHFPYSRASHGRAHLWHLWCRHCAHSHRTLYVWNSRAWKERRPRANAGWQTCCLMAKARHSTYGTHTGKQKKHASNSLGHRSARSSSPFRLTPGLPQASASASASPLLAPHGTNHRNGRRVSQEIGTTC